MAPAIIAAIISAAASKVKSNQASAMKMNEGNKTAGDYQLNSGNGSSSGATSYQPISQSTSTVGTGGGDLAKSIVKEYLEKKLNNNAEPAADTAGEVASDTTNEIATETAENVAENIH